jgi:L-cysteine S-thiosulfotransferase
MSCKYALRCAALFSFLAIAFSSIALNAVTDPEQERVAFIKLYQKKFPDRPLEDYVYGALMLSEDAKQQYDSIMEWPPFSPTIEQGKLMWETPFKNGKTYADCFPNGGKMIAGEYPKYDEKLGKVVTFEMAINQCLVANGETPLKISDMKTMGVLMSYARTLSDGMKMNIKVNSSAALEKFEAGKQFFFTRRGQLNFACASCHVQNAGNTLRTELLSPTVGQATHWPVFRGGDNLNTIQARYKRCLEQIRAVPLEQGGDDFNNLEYFHSYLSNGLPLKASVYRK